MTMVKLQVRVGRGSLARLIYRNDKGNEEGRAGRRCQKF
jgi:hypothetical protein